MAFFPNWLMDQNDTCQCEFSYLTLLFVFARNTINVITTWEIKNGGHACGNKMLSHV